MVGAFIVIMFLGAGTIFIIIEDAGNQTIVLRLVGAFVGLITAIVGFATGFLLGQRNGNGHNGQ